MLVTLVVGIYTNRTNLLVSGDKLLFWILMFLLGWQVFGAPLHG